MICWQEHALFVLVLLMCSSLWWDLKAAAYPKSHITAVSNSSSQKEYIDSRASQMKLSNVTVITEDIVNFEASGQYDRVVSIEMFEHMKNYEVGMVEAGADPYGDNRSQVLIAGIRNNSLSFRNCNNNS